MAVTDAKKKANKKWDSENMKQVGLVLPIKEAEALQFYCDQKGIKRTTFIRKAIQDAMKREPLENIQE